MANLNRIILVGEVTSETEVKAGIDGSPLAKFGMSVVRFIKDGQPQGSDFFNIVAWGQHAQICGSLKKGQNVLVEGRIQIRSFDNESGQRQWVTEIIARRVQPLSAGEKVVSSAPSDGFNISEEDDLPF